MIFGINTTCNISKLSQITILKYHSWYLCQISHTNHAIAYTKTLEISALIEETIHCYLMLPNSNFFLSAFENMLEVYKYLKMKF